MLAERALPSGEDVTADTRISIVAELWLREVDESDRAPNTRRRYREVVELYVVPGLGGLRVREATVAAVDRFLRSTRDKTGAATAKLCKTTLSGILGLAARHGAAPSNVMRDTTAMTPKSNAVRALTVAEARALRLALRRDRKAVRADLVDLIDCLLGTGVRIGEALALRWSDVDLSSATPTILIAGTVIRVTGTGLVIQPHPKSKHGRRRLSLPGFLVDVLLARQVDAAGGSEYVFPSSVGTLRDPTNVRDQWRAARDRAGFAWVVPTTFRKSVGTLLGASDLRIAAGQLGHSGTAVTERHYVARTYDGPDARDALDVFGQRGDDTEHAEADANNPDDANRR